MATSCGCYDPQNGQQLWHCECPAGRGSPTVTPANGLLYVVNGLSGGGVYCVTPGGSGNVTSSHRQWFTGRNGRDLSSPIVVGNSVMVMGLRSSILTAYDATNGSQQWIKRIGGQISASPVAYQGLAFFIDESGKTIVVDPESSERIIAENQLVGEQGELFRAAITPCNGQLFIRSDQALYCIGASAAGD